MTGVHPRDSVARFAHDLTEARREAGRSIRQVHRLTGIPTATLGGYFAGRHLPPANRPEVLREVLTACAVPSGEHAAWRQRLLDLYAQRRQVEVTRTPYPGLRPFDAADHDLFFGREELVDRLLRMLEDVVDEQHPVLMVVGPSGSGKSSLLRAGLQAALTGLGCTVCRPSEIEAALRDLPEAAEPGPAGLRQILIVDQLEELWTDPDLKARAEELLDQLEVWSAAAPGRVLVLGLRADFYGEAMGRPSLATALQHRQLLVEPMSPEAMRAAIEGPAGQVGLTLEPGLVEVILADAAVDTGTVGSVLPHLAHVLDTMWSASDRKALTVEDYRRAGGFAGAIRQSAEQALSPLPVETQALAMTLLLRMVATAPAQGWTRRLAPLAELTDLGKDAPEVLGHLVDRRLVTVRADDATLSHESLVGAWPRLRDAVETRRGDLARREALERAATDWDSHGRSDDHLLRGARLQATADWAASTGEPLTTLQEDYLAASHRLSQHIEQERLTRARRRRAVIAAMAVLLLLTTGASLTAINSFDEARMERNQAQARQMAVAATSMRETNPGVYQQLAVAAHRTAETRETRSAVLDASTSPVITSWSRPDAVLERTVTLAGGEHVLFSGPEGGVVLAAPAPTGQRWQVLGQAALDDGPGSPVVSRLATHPRLPWAAVAGVFATEDDPSAAPLLAVLDLTTPASPVVSWLQLPASEPAAGQEDVRRPLTPTGLAFADGGSLLLVADSHGRLHRYAVGGGTPEGAGAEGATTAPDLGDGEAVGPPEQVGADALVEELSASADGDLVAGALSSGTVLLWEVADGELTLVGEHETPRDLFALDMAADGSALAAVGRSGLVHWLQVSDAGLEETHTMFASDTNLFAVRIDPAVEFLSVSGWDGRVSGWRLGEDGPVTELPGLVLPVPRPVLELDVVAGRWTFATLGGTVYSWESESSVLPSLPGNVFMVGTSHDPPRFMTSTGPPEGALTVWDATQPHAPVALHTLRASGEDVSTGAGAISTDGRYAAMGTAAGRVVVWDVSGEEAQQVVDVEVAPEAVITVAFTPDSDGVLTLGRAGMVRLVSLEDGTRGQLRDEVELPAGAFAVGMGPSGVLAASDNAGGVHLVHLDDLATTLATIDPGASAYGLEFSADGQTLALSTGANEIQFYDVSDPAAPTEVGDRLTGPTSIPNSVKFSPDGQQLAVAAVAGQAWIYTRQDEEWQATEVLRAGLVNLQDVTWSPDGSVLLGGALSGRTRLWLTDVDTAATWVCGGVGEDVTQEEWEGLLPGIDYAPPCAAGTG